MTTSTSRPVTELLLAWRQGDQAALEQLIPLIYQELRRLARRYMKSQPPGHTLQATALVNEAYVRLIDCQQVDWKGRAHLLSVSARMIARELRKRGGYADRTLAAN